MLTGDPTQARGVHGSRPRSREGIFARTDARVHCCRIDAKGQPRCTCGWHEQGQFTSGGARCAEIDHLISVGATWAEPRAV